MNGYYPNDNRRQMAKFCVMWGVSGREVIVAQHDERQNQFAESVT